MIGITGQIGAGKSFVGQMLRERGFRVLDADLAVHELYRDSAGLRAAIAREFGGETLTADGVNRKFIADLIFRDESARKHLEALVYPVLTEYVMLRNPDFVEAALFENVPELVKTLDGIWVVIASEETRFHRLVNRRGLSAEDARRRMDLQSAKNNSETWKKLFPGKEIRFIENNDGSVPEI